MIARRRLIQAAAALSLLGALSAKAVTTGGGDMSLGDPNAKVTVIEYGSASCTHCARFNNDIFPAFKAKYVDTGKVRYVFREFLTEPVDLAAAAFLLARCAGKDKYFSVLDDFFHAQADIYKTGDATPALLKIAKDAGLAPDQANACLNDKAALAALNARVQSYIANDKISGTPTFFVDGQRLDGVQTLAQLDAAIAHAEAAADPSRRGSPSHTATAH
ncbi:MAG TPA: thioredoxin domain-containing protein [Caulobacteraceae bacterium]|jgi:protein-disulfide isomerase|nr:thioredoxin domain-containing protein [Caulobacteraceae bacterium]